MNRIQKHITSSLLAGFVALLPIGGLVLTVGYLEATISSSGLSNMPFYFPGLGLIVSILFIYLIGLAVTTFIGRWIWSRIDKLLYKMPTLGRLYETLKQILGYGEGKEAIFHEAVLVPNKDIAAEELGLITNKLTDEEGNSKLVVFIPGAPNPTSGRLLIMDPDSVKRLSMPVNETLKALVSMGKTDINLK
jgi:uncharacterized membrane protein